MHHSSTRFSGLIALLIALFMAQHTCQGQTEEILKSKKIKDRISIRFYPPKSNPIEYVIDKDYRNPISKKLKTPMNVVASDEAFKVFTRFVNPLTHSVVIEQSSIDDPASQQTKEFLSTTTQLFNQMGASEFTKPTTPESPLIKNALDKLRSGGENLTFEDVGKAQNNNGNGVAPKTIEETINSKTKSSELLDLYLWLYVGTKNPKNCRTLNPQYKEPLIAHLTSIEDRLYSFPDSAKLLLKSMTEPKTYGEVKPRMIEYQIMLKNLRKNVSNMTKEASIVKKMIPAQTDGKSSLENYCTAISTYTKGKLDNYINKTEEQAKTRQALLDQFESMINLINKELIEADKNTIDDQYFNEKGYIEAEDEKVKIVDIKIIENNITFVDNTISVTKKETLVSTLRVRPYSFIVAEYGVGVVFTELKFPRFAAQTDPATGEVTVQKSSPDIVNIVPATVLNLYPASLKTNVYPILQIGMGSGQNRPSFFLGTGLRFLKPNRFTFSFGPIWTWRKELTQLEINQRISGQGDIERDLKFRFGSRPNLFLGVQYNF